MNVLQSLGVKQMQRIFTETGHGKGPADGVGAAVKRKSDQYVSEGPSIDGAKDLQNALTDGRIF